MKKPFRIWDSRQLSEAYVIATQIKEQIEMLFLNTDAGSLRDLPHSMVPTDNLYEIVSGYHALFDASLENDLLMTGNKKAEHKFH
jgi:hypothetical protein